MQQRRKMRNFFGFVKLPHLTSANRDIGFITEVDRNGDRLLTPGIARCTAESVVFLSGYTFVELLQPAELPLD